jgi:ABC-type transport system involved in cytochrome bd biosynthesis fused ATPase/permease subunit
MAFSSLASSLTSFSRIQGFMNRTAREEKRSLPFRQNSTPGESDMLKQPREHRRGEIELREITDQEQSVVAYIQGHASWPGAEHGIYVSGWRIHRGSFTLVLGPVASGKSTLLRCVLGEHSAFDGEISFLSEGVAFCSENPWIPARTVQGVIVGEERFNPALYESVLDACALRQDLENWPHGDKTNVGSKGITLSGGQKHRLVC